MSKLSYYGSSSDFYNEQTDPDRMGRGSSVNQFLVRGEINITKGMSRLTESIEDILSTPIGTRFFAPQYGSNLFLLLYEQNDFVAKDMSIEYTKEALTKWEPRLELISVDASIEDYVMNITVKYAAKDTGTVGSYVYTLERKVPELT